MRFFFHVSDCARDTFNPDWRGTEFENIEKALGFARTHWGKLSEKQNFKGYVIVSNNNAVKLAILMI